MFKFLCFFLLFQSSNTDNVDLPVKGSPHFPSFLHHYPKFRAQQVLGNVGDANGRFGSNLFGFFLLNIFRNRPWPQLANPQPPIYIAYPTNPFPYHSLNPTIDLPSTPAPNPSTTTPTPPTTPLTTTSTTPTTTLSTTTPQTTSTITTTSTPLTTTSTTPTTTLSTTTPQTTSTITTTSTPLTTTTTTPTTTLSTTTTQTTSTITTTTPTSTSTPLTTTSTTPPTTTASPASSSTSTSTPANPESTNIIDTCGSTAMLNNTYWQTSPTNPRSSSLTCVLTVQLDTKLEEQKLSICQVRLDFVLFSVAQPTADGNCQDYFYVEGSKSSVPTICGDNNGQHMYIQVPPSDSNPTDLQLIFSFVSTSSAAWSLWNIQLSLLPCGASYLAPPNCLQYFTASSGQITSFNWRDVAVSSTRQLNNQHYNICFRTELIGLRSKEARQLCLSICTLTAEEADAFSLSGTNKGDCEQNNAGAVAVPGCSTDFLQFLKGRNADFSSSYADRFCGSALNADSTLIDEDIEQGNMVVYTSQQSRNSVEVCSSTKPFNVAYNTDENESSDLNNQGFCLFYRQL